jgi:hypothetical protein
MSTKPIAQVGTRLIATVFILLFLILWGALLVDVFTFDPTPSDPQVVLTDAQQTILAFLATTLATGTAAVLGITIVNDTSQRNTTTGTFRTQARASWAVITESSILWLGIAAYLVVGVLVLLAWYFKGSVSPEPIATFGASVLGWGAGAVAAVFKAST